MSSPELYVVTAEVRRSADQVTVLADEASSSRAALADSISGQGTAWKTAGRAGFATFVDILDDQATRLRADLKELADTLRAAADVYEKQDLEAKGAFDSAVSYD